MSGNRCIIRKLLKPFGPVFESSSLCTKTGTDGGGMDRSDGLEISWRTFPVDELAMGASSAFWRGNKRLIDPGILYPTDGSLCAYGLEAIWFIIRVAIFNEILPLWQKNLKAWAFFKVFNAKFFKNCYYSHSSKYSLYFLANMKLQPVDSALGSLPDAWRSSCSVLVWLLLWWEGAADITSPEKPKCIY